MQQSPLPVQSTINSVSVHNHSLRMYVHLFFVTKTCLSLSCSHDILAVRRWNSVANRARAVNMMTNDNATAAYIENALLPMLAALKEPIRPGGPTYLDAVVSWDVLNEPEGVSSHWRLYKVGAGGCVGGNGKQVCAVPRRVIVCDTAELHACIGVVPTCALRSVVAS